MKQEDKKLLIKDLCARLPYGVKVKSLIDSKPVKLVGFDGIHFYDENDGEWNIEDIQPYLFPIFSMTEEQANYIYFSEKLDVTDWLNEHHFDYRGLIDKNIAINTTGLNIYDKKVMNYVTYKQAVKLKKLGFNWECCHYYDEDKQFSESIYEVTQAVSNFIININNLSDDFNKDEDTISAPTLEQAAKWLREVKNSLIVCTPVTDIYESGDKIEDLPTGQWQYELWHKGKEHLFIPTPYPSYEEALSAGIDSALISYGLH